MVEELGVVRDAIAAFNAHDAARVGSFYRDDAVLITPDAGEIRGRDLAEDYNRKFIEAFPDGRMEIAMSYECGDTVVAEWIFRGVNTGPLPLPSGEDLPATGRQVETHGVDIVHVIEGGIARHRSYWDQVELLTQLELTSDG